MSTLKVGTIQDHANSNTAMTISSGGVVTQPKMPFFMINLSGDQGSVADNSETVVQFNNRMHDPDSLWDTSNYRLTVDANTKGYWWMHTNIYTNGTNNIENTHMKFRVNGTSVAVAIGAVRQVGGTSTSTNEAVYSFSAVVDLTTASNYFDVAIVQDISSGGTSTINEGGNPSVETRTYVCGHRLR